MIEIQSTKTIYTKEQMATVRGMLRLFHDKYATEWFRKTYIAVRSAPDRFEGWTDEFTIEIIEALHCWLEGRAMGWDDVFTKWGIER